MNPTLPFAAEAGEWLGRALGVAPDELEVARLKGSTSSSVYLVRFGADRRRTVLRVVDNPAWLAEERDQAPHEAAALAEALRAGLRAPRPIAHADDAGFGGPAILMSFLEGAIELRPADRGRWLGGLAGELAAIHSHRAEGFPWQFKSWVDRAALAVPAWTRAPRAWQRAIDYWLRGAPASQPVFLHRDYHQTNVLWQGGAVSGVVDWINACRGPAGVDVGHCRGNLVKMLGQAAADEFLAAYRAAADGFEYQPYWDIEDIIDTCARGAEFYPPWAEFGLDPIPAAELERRVDEYVERLAALI